MACADHPNVGPDPSGGAIDGNAAPHLTPVLIAKAMRLPILRGALLSANSASLLTTSFRLSERPQSGFVAALQGWLGHAS